MATKPHMTLVQATERRNRMCHVLHRDHANKDYTPPKELSIVDDTITRHGYTRNEMRAVLVSVVPEKDWPNAMQYAYEPKIEDTNIPILRVAAIHFLGAVLHITQRTPTRFRVIFYKATAKQQEPV